MCGGYAKAVMKRILLACLFSLAACDNGSVRDTLGLTRKAPDEFRVVSRPPLSVPPDFTLRPPAAPGEVPSGGVTASQTAQALVFGGEPQSSVPAEATADTAVMPVTEYALASPADAQFLANAGADKADANIRDFLYQENAAADSEDKGFIEKLREPFNAEPTVDAEKEAERLKENKEAGAPVTQGETPTTKPKDTGTLGRIFGY